MNQKRRLNEEFEERKFANIDEEFLLQQKRILTKTEFMNLIPDGGYDDYRKKYYKIAVKEALLKYWKTEWFAERYLTKKELVHGDESNELKSNNLDRFSYINEENRNSENLWYFISEVKGSASDLIEQHSSHAAEIHIVQNGINFGFTRDMYVLTSSKESIKNGRMIEIKEDICCHIKCSIPQIKAIYKSLNSLFSEKIDDLEGIDSRKEFNSILRSKFNFCLTCCTKYDATIQMKDICSKFHDKHFNNRRRFELLGTLVNEDGFLLEEMNDPIFWLTSMFNVSRDGARCLECHKLYANESGVCKHLLDSHYEIARDAIDCSNIIKNIDLYLLDWLDGTLIDNPSREKEYNSTPFFGKVKKPLNSVKYNLPKIYSGEINNFNYFIYLIIFAKFFIILFICLYL